MTSWKILLLLMPVNLASPAPAADFAPSAEGECSSLEPRIEGMMSARLRFALNSALAISILRLRREPECRGLFVQLGDDGKEVLTRTRYYVAPDPLREHVCRARRAAAFTTVGGDRTALCPARFAELTRFEAAAILLHEALHHAGLPERPQNPGAMTSIEISRLVARSCGLPCVR